jgi:phosphoglycolate phosphatase
MIGDRSHDILGARANGIFPVGALWGYGSRQELLLAGVGLLCEEPRHLTQVIPFVKGLPSDDATKIDNSLERN